MEKKQTAVEWLIHKIHENPDVWIQTHLQIIALEMEKGQIIHAICSDDRCTNYNDAEDFYNKHYGKETDRS